MKSLFLLPLLLAAVTSEARAADETALAQGGLAAITFVTADETAMRAFLMDGFRMQERVLAARDAEQTATQAGLWGLDGIESWKEIWLERSTSVTAPAIRLLVVPAVTPLSRNTVSAARDGGVSISFSLARDSGALQRLHASGIDYFSNFEVPLANPDGGTYVVEEFYVAGPDNLIVPVVVRPPGMPPTAPIDADTGFGGPAYAGLTVPAADPEIDFYKRVLGLEMRRDIELTEPALLKAAGLPGDATVRFVQMFAPGTTTANLTLVDLGSKGERNPVAFRPPNRGMVMWSFLISDAAEAARRARGTQGSVVRGPITLHSPVWGAHRTLIVATPGGFHLELIERLRR